MTDAVLLGAATPGWRERLARIAGAASMAAGDVTASLELAREWGVAAPLPAAGRTRELWEMLATIAAADLTVARVIEPHLDALAILAQAGANTRTSNPVPTWGVFAAEGPGLAVTAIRDGDAWRLNGVKPWCSLAGVLDRALITAHTGAGSRRLFDINLRDAGVSAGDGTWVARGLSQVRSVEVHLDGVRGRPVGDDNWYLRRPGFAWGGIGVAAIWFGASVALARTMRAAMMTREPDQIGLMQLGEADVLIESCRAVLASAAEAVDEVELTEAVDTHAQDAAAGHPQLLAQRARSVVSAAAERMIAIAGHALGPAPLARNEEHARRVADLTLYLRQDHAERDLASLGRAVLALALGEHPAEHPVAHPVAHPATNPAAHPAANPAPNSAPDLGPPPAPPTSARRPSPSPSSW